ncbi:sensor histidine kinase [Caballeronia sp. GAWG1-1]|uniref:sensor histidine kinase n=1 Tax=Caballeronia sp. GAWG1-1 TaxID=2921742 RepID=UPI002028BFB0|nr:sensor histidine kinase [Caballeronia sp. GAWG1-1]
MASTISDFIEADLDGLIDEWTEYARAVSPLDSELNDEQLRDSGRELLLGIAADMRESQTDAQQEAKSQGRRPDPNSGFNRIGRGHADDRQIHGFGIDALVAEYRALRASALRRWQRTCELDASAFQEIIRFNEAIDQMVAESVRQYAQRTERIRDLFAGVVAHDMRLPVGAILNSAHVVLLDENLSATSVRASLNLQRSAERLKLLIDDLFVFTRTRVGDTLPVEPTQQDFTRICLDATDDVRSARPDAQVEVHSSGHLDGRWDAARLNQLIVNLITNAVQYGNGPVQVNARGDDEQVTLVVSNGGTAIPVEALPTLSDPLTRGSPTSQRGGIASGVGRSLYLPLHYR